MKIKHLLRPSFLCLFILLPLSQAIAHEHRSINDGRFEFSVGWMQEPAYEDEINGISLSINKTEFGFPEPLSELFGDVVDLHVTVMFLEVDASDAKVLASTMLKDPLEDRGGSMVARFKPTHDGAYGFHIQGQINGEMIDEIFICGGGSQSLASAFGCVVDPQAFPGNLKHDDDHKSSKDKAGYKDNDKYSLSN